MRKNQTPRSIHKRFVCAIRDRSIKTAFFPQGLYIGVISSISEVDQVNHPLHAGHVPAGLACTAACLKFIGDCPRARRPRRGKVTDSAHLNDDLYGHVSN